MEAGMVENATEDVESCLKVFTVAKQVLIDFFDQLHEFSGDLYNYLTGPDIDSIIDRKNAQDHSNVADNRLKISAILKMLSRNNMKVCFFGRTSNGKSSVINCMLRDRILPSGLGHTANCFLQIEGADTDSGAYCLLPRRDDHFPVSVLSKLAGDEGNEYDIGIKELVRIIWPRKGCSFLSEEIVLIDSPGIDVSPDMDTWIEKYCVDADVFVLVCNAEAVLSSTERNFFVSVSQKLSSPNIFILNNRWDLTSTEKRVDELRKQHQKLECEFLCNRLKVCASQAEAQKRIFFVSAKETLSKRILEVRPDADETLIDLPGQDERSDEFEHFEREFTRCISHSALKTKFKPHAEQGVRICHAYIDSLELIKNQLTMKKRDLEQRHSNYVGKAEMMEQKLYDLTAFVKDKIRQVSMIVQDKVSSALKDETIRLSELVDKFSVPFGSDSYNLSFYKNELNKYMEQKLGENLSGRLGRVLSSTTESVQKDVKHKIIRLLDEDPSSIKDVEQIFNRTDFSAAYKLYFSNLCADFKEDISFKFSLSPSILFAKFAQRFRSSAAYADSTLSNRLSGASNSNGNAAETIRRYSLQHQSAPSSLSTATNTLVAMQAVTYLSSSHSAAALAILSGSTIAFRAWKILIGAGLVIGGAYLIERSMWTKKAQQRMFNRQYVEFASAKLKMVTEKTSGNASQQVQQELSLYFAQVCRFADQSKDRILDQVLECEERVAKLSNATNRVIGFLNKACQLRNSICEFGNKFLRA